MNTQHVDQVVSDVVLLAKDFMVENGITIADFFFDRDKYADLFSEYGYSRDYAYALFSKDDLKAIDSSRDPFETEAVLYDSLCVYLYTKYDYVPR